MPLRSTNVVKALLRKEIREDESDGCGISKWWNTGPNDPFFDECNWHDPAYVKGSWQQKHLSRKRTDRHFRLMMERKIQAADGWFNKLKLRARAQLYYLLTRTLGGPYWEGDQK